MPRKPDMKSKIFKLKLNTRKRLKNRSKTNSTGSESFVVGNSVSYTYSNNLAAYLSVIKTIFDVESFCKSSLLPYQETILIERSFRISGSSLHRILSWKQNSFSIFQKILDSQSFAPKENDYEIELWKLLSKFHDMLLDHGICDFSIGEGPFWFDNKRPYLCGTPDFAMFNEETLAAVVIEAKCISSESEFKRHCSYSPQNGFQLRQSSEYFHQIRAYMNIFKAHSGLLLIKANNAYFYVCLEKLEFTAEELNKLKLFYTQFFIPMKILKRIPDRLNEQITFGDEFNFENLQNKFKNEELWIKLMESFAFREDFNPSNVKMK